MGPLVHARLGVARDHSGKLVSRVREEARAVAERQDLDLVLVDGAPGIGCPVIASITGADLVLVVSEPTPSGLSDLERVLELARGFQIPAAVCINKFDLNPEMARRIAGRASSAGAAVVGKIPFDPGMTAAMIAGRALPEMDPSPAGAAMDHVWHEVNEMCRKKTEREL
jgi:MinD superfamily P-loop ATPase